MVNQKQEGLTSVARHEHASRVSLLFELHDDDETARTPQERR